MFASHYTFLVPFASLVLPALVRADCECGYVVNSTLYTDLLETDFLHSSSLSTDWQAQKYSVQPQVSRGPYGKDAEPDNVVTNPLKSKDNWSGNGTKGGEAGLQLIVRGGIPKDQLIPMAELVSTRQDMLYGSFRTAMRMTGTNGTCGAFFWYFDDTQEIDMEFLSKQYNDSSKPVNLVLQSPASTEAGFDASRTGTFETQQLPYSPADGFHEYRFDWTPDSVSFFADGHLLQTMTKAIPTSAGHITISHWSNGDAGWSAGPPEKDATVTVSYFKGYFNSSDQSRQDKWHKRCTDPTKVNATCEVPELTQAPDGDANAKTYFFTKEKDKTPGQTVAGAGKKSEASPSAAVWCGIPGFSAMALVAMLCL